MKKWMWMFAMLPMMVTGIVFQFMPDELPMHYDVEGNINRWGNKAEHFIVPIIILFLALFWHFLINVYEKKAVTATREKEQMEAKSTAKLLGIVGISQTIMFGVMQCFVLYTSYMEASVGATKASVDISQITSILMGVTFVVIGNFMSKVKMNAVAGVRTSWSMYNDNTWRESNRFGAVCLVVAGIATIITACIVGGMATTILMLVYIMVAAVASVMYSKKVYEKEKRKESAA